MNEAVSLIQYTEDHLEELNKSSLRCDEIIGQFADMKK